MQAMQSGIALGMKLDVRGGNEMGPSGGFGVAEDAAELPPLSLLVVDDDGPVRNACRDAAVRMSFVVTVAEDVAAARTVLQRQKVDLALLDLKMPGGGGLALFEAMKREHPETGVVVMTGVRDGGERGGGDAAGGDGLSDQAIPAGGADSGARAGAAVAAGGCAEPAVAGAAAHGARHGRDDRAVGGDGEAVPLSVEGGVLDASGADPGRRAGRARSWWRGRSIRAGRARRSLLFRWTVGR